MFTRVKSALAAILLFGFLAPGPPAGATPKVAPIAVVAEQAPAVFTVQFETTKGTFVVAAYRSWAPLAVDRLYNLVRSGYLDGNLFFRVVPGSGVDCGLNGNAKTTKAWGESPIPCDPPRRKIQAGDVYFLNNGLGEKAATEMRFQTGPDDGTSTRSGTTPIGRIVEGSAVLESLDASHMADNRKWMKLIRQLLKDGEEPVRKNYPHMDAILRATLDERAAEPPTELAETIEVPPGMALVQVYRTDKVGQDFTLRIDGSARTVLKANMVYGTLLPAGTHEVSTKVRFKMFATGLLDKAFASGGAFSTGFEAGRVYHLRAVPVGDLRTLRLHPVANDFGAEECKPLSVAMELGGKEEE
jgi:cyclophilin family peptidyl-prolyl cis-trans isomerase